MKFKKEMVAPINISLILNEDNEHIFNALGYIESNLKDLAKSLLKFQGYKVDQSNFFYNGMPQAIFDLLEWSNQDQALIAAKTFLEKNGFVVTNENKEG